MELFEGIIVTLSHYKNDDAVIGVLTKNGLMTVDGRGSYKPSSKTNKFLHPFLYGQFEVYKGPVGGYKLKDCNIIEMFDGSFSGYEDLIFSQLISEISFKMMVDNPDLTGYFDNLLNFLKFYKKSTNKYILVCYYIAQLLKINGTTLYLTGCVNCGEKNNIVGIDLDEGGLVCKQHVTIGTKPLSNAQFKVYDSLFNKEICDVVDIKLTKDDFLYFISNLYYLLIHNFDFELKTMKLIESL